MRFRAARYLFFAALITLAITAIAIGREGGTLAAARKASEVSPTDTVAAGPSLGVLSPRSPSQVGSAPGKGEHRRTKPPADSEEPTAPVPPDAPPVPSDPPVPPAAPGAVSEVVCTSGDMADTITFLPPADGGPVDAYVLSAATSAGGPFSPVASVAAQERRFVVSVDTTGTPYYRIAASGPGGTGSPSCAVTNSHVSIAAQVGPTGATLRSSNGELALRFPAGAVAATSTVSVEELEGSPSGGIIALAGVYDISSSEPLASPVRLSVAYTIKVTHFQVSAAMLAQASLMTYDASTGAWSAQASNVSAAEGMLSGDLGHFSYWSAALIQPHGTQSTAFCSDGGICHNLAPYPDATTRISSRDPQVCYNCHGSEDLSTGPAGASGENIEAAIRGAGSLSHHPVAIGDLYCTSCHDPHANPATSPGLLRAIDPTGSYVQGGGGSAPGASFCWTCHGAVSNRRIEYLVPGYWANSGGDKKTGFNGAHTAVRSATTRLDSSEELGQGMLRSTEVRADGVVAVTTTQIELPKTQTPVVVPAVTGNWGGTGGKAAYDGDWANTKFYWTGTAMGATVENGMIGTGSLAIDLGSQTDVRSFECYFLNNLSCVADVTTVQTSNDGVTWTPLVSRGTLGVALNEMRITLEGSATCRYVRFVFEKKFNAGGDVLAVTEVGIHGVPSLGTFDVRPDIARKAPFAGGKVSWQAAVPSPATLEVTVRASVNNGTTWTAWEPISNGGSITQIPVGTSLENALLEVRATMTRVAGQETLFDWIEVKTTRGAMTGATPQWSGTSPANECQRCHLSHGSAQTGLAVADTITVCTTCHSAAYGGSYGGATAFNGSVHQNVQCASCHTAHGNAGGAKVSYPFLLKNGRREECLSCHATVAAAFNANQGGASEWAKHDIFSVEQVKTGSRLGCGNCHSVHVSSTGLVDPDSITTPFTTMRDDPTTIPTGEVVVYASKDTLIDSTAGQQTWNYGAAGQFTVTQANKALLYFDLSAIPAGATIQNATLVLWGTSPLYSTYKGYMKIYPASRSWAEGTGTGTPNSASVNGASWLEWQYGDNANSGNVAGGDWAAAGGDYLVSPSATMNGVNAVNVTALVRQQWPGSNYGLVLTGLDATSYAPFYSRENATQQYRPRLRIVYQTGPATAQVVDDITFCSKCHDGSMPLGLSGQSLQSVATLYATGAHGGGKGLGPESSIFNFYNADAGGGGLKAPYTYGMDALPCTTCHDPHGSRLPYHLKEVVNGQSMIPYYGDNWAYGAATSGSGLGYFCSACHIFPPNHSGYQNSGENCSTGCHSHAGR